jgi:hypothetical protein
MSGPLKFSAGMVTGFAFGAIIGFAWAQGTKKSLSNNVETTVDGQAVTVRVNYAAAARDGLLEALSR